MSRAAKPPPWKRENPKPKAARGTLSEEQKARARARAEAAGRPYPNLVDNMWAAREGGAAARKPTKRS